MEVNEDDLQHIVSFKETTAAEVLHWQCTHRSFYDRISCRPTLQEPVVSLQRKQRSCLHRYWGQDENTGTNSRWRRPSCQNVQTQIQHGILLAGSWKNGSKEVNKEDTEFTVYMQTAQVDNETNPLELWRKCLPFSCSIKSSTKISGNTRYQYPSEWVFNGWKHCQQWVVCCQKTSTCWFFFNKNIMTFVY